MLILASQSPRRRELIARLNRPYQCMEPDFEECIPEGMPAEEIPQYFAHEKAEAAFQTCSSMLEKQDVILAADTVVLLDGEILGKPQDEREAAEMLRRLSGRTHEVITAVCIFCGGHKEEFSVHTKVSFYSLSEEEITHYIQADRTEWYDKAGAYGIQSAGALFVREIQGDFYNVIGLPIAETERRLRQYE